MRKFNPLDHPACFSHPLWIAPSSWIEHVPFAMFLIDALRPKLLVELGTAFGVSYCAFCQAVKELELDASCYAIDTWEGDSQTGVYGPEVLAELRKHHDPLYGSFSSLVQTTFDDALAHFENGTIDLLHIDGFHTYETVRHDFDNWLPKMSAEGIVLLHDINVRDQDFGVWKVWEELKAEYPHFEFLHEHGLGLLAVGRQSSSLSQLLNVQESELSNAREFFYQLGLRLRTQVEKDEEIRGLNGRINELNCAIEGREAQLSKEREEASKLVSGKDQTINILATDLLALAARQLEMERESQALQERFGEKDQALQALTARIYDSEKEGEALSIQEADKGQLFQKVSTELAEKNAELDRINASFGGRLLNRYGKLKYAYLMPIWRLLHPASGRKRAHNIKQ